MSTASTVITAAERRRALLQARADEFARVTIKNIRKEFPNDIRSLMRHPGDFPNRPKDIQPAFYGCLDWHSAVEMHWMLVRLLRVAPELVPADDIRAALDEHFTAEALTTEARSLTPRSRPYGWAWALELSHEVVAWDDPDARRWSANFTPLDEAVTEKFVRWLPKQRYPIRHGVHANDGFGLLRSLAYARLRAERGRPELLTAITDAAQRWFGEDTDYPGGWEPSGADFLSPALTEAVLMAELLPPTEFRPWFDRFLPGVADREPAALFTPATVDDDSDGQIAHLHGLNLSRAWCWRRLAESLPGNDPLVPVMLDAAARHAEPELDSVSGTDYLVEHWLACYAVLYLT